MKSKVFAVLMTLSLLCVSSCIKNQENEGSSTPEEPIAPEVTPTPSPEATAELKNWVSEGDLTFCAKDYCHVIVKSLDSGSINSWMFFLTALKLEETEISNEDQLSSLTFDEHKVIFYGQDIVEIDESVYRITNVNELKESKHAYKFEQLNPELFMLIDYINEANITGMGISYTGGYTAVEFKDDTLKKEIAEELSKIVVFDPGFPEYGAGGYGFEITFNNGSVKEENGVHLYVNNEKLTTKQSSCLNGSITKVMIDILIKQGVMESEDEIGAIIKGFETNQLKAYPTGIVK